ncbi:hypothetical protein INT43_008955 [Umbelopsis isabellina]|uniref:C3H1-type domain-containing protein n=1 Tax=Mortierella isabellina TaxID=91625 RepID=A0A8H7UH00_MORIS|nr:hypothetical protein INT43_008955 [Umbelopsis isabellina]
MPDSVLETLSALSLLSSQLNGIMKAPALSKDAHCLSEQRTAVQHPMLTNQVSACHKNNISSQKNKSAIAVEKRKQKISSRDKYDVLSCKTGKTHALKRSNLNKSKQKTRVIFTDGMQCSYSSIGPDLTEKPKIAGAPLISPSEDSRRQGNNEENSKGLKDKKSDLYKTEICRNWQEIGYCRYGKKCRYAHGQSELRAVKRHQRYKTEICRTYHETGTCPYGVRCTFIHNERSLANPNIVFNMGRFLSKKPSNKLALRDYHSTTSSPDISVGSMEASVDQSTSSSDESSIEFSQSSFAVAFDSDLPLDDMEHKHDLADCGMYSSTRYPINPIPFESLLDMLLLETQSKDMIMPKIYNYFSQFNNDDTYQLAGKTFLKTNEAATSFSAPMSSASKFSWQVSPLTMPRSTPNF